MPPSLVYIHKCSARAHIDSYRRLAVESEHPTCKEYLHFQMVDFRVYIATGGPLTVHDRIGIDVASMAKVRSQIAN